MKKSYLKYLDDEISSPEEELLKLRQQRLEQAAIRLEQRERHIKLQEEKTRLLEEKRRAEEIEKRKQRLKKVFVAFLKGVGTVASVATAIVGLLSYLRQEAQYSPEAAMAYRGIINILEQMLSAIKHGGSIAKDAFLGMFNKLSKAVKYVLNAAKDRYLSIARVVKHDSNAIAKYIKKDVAIKLRASRLRTDSSFYRTNRYADSASNYVNRAIRVYDRRHGDLFPLAIPAGIALSKATIIPLLITILKTGVISGIASGVAGAVKEPLKENITKPLCDRIINNIKLAAANKRADQTYLQAISEKISSDMNTLLNILKREKSFIATKLESAWNKVRGLFKK